MRKFFSLFASLIITFSLFLSFNQNEVHAGTIRYVNAAATGANNGTSWVNAYKTIQAALTAASSGDEIWVAAGNYSPGTTTNTYTLKSGVALYGGFAGTESSLSGRNYTTNLTIINGNNSTYTLFTGSSVTGVILDGFTVTGSNNTSSSGGGLKLINSSSATVRNSIFSNLKASTGAGIYVNGAGNLIVDNVTFRDSTASGFGGAGIHFDSSGSILVKDSLFYKNQGASYGGAFYTSTSSTAVVKLANTKFIDNQIVNGGGANGSAIHAYGQIQIINSFFNHNGSLAGNSTSGAIALVLGTTGSAQVVNSTIVNSYGHSYALAFEGTLGRGVLYNSIVVGNTLNTSTGDHNYCTQNNCGSAVTTVPTFVSQNGVDGVAYNLDDDYQLASGSTGVNAGDNSRLFADFADLDADGNTTETTPYDLNHQPRVVGTAVDLGAYEQLVLVDTTPPINPTTITESQGSQNGVWQKTVAVPSFSWSGASDASGIAGYEVAWGTDANAEVGSYQTATTFTPAAVTTGTYYLRLRTKDAAPDGNYSTWFTAFTFKYDNSAPAYVESSSVTETHGITYGAESSVSKPSFTWATPNEVGSGIAGYNVYFGNYISGTTANLVTTPAYAVTTAISGSEIYYLRLQTVDNAGNTSTWRTVFLYEHVLGAAPTNVSAVTEANGYNNNTWHGLSQNAPTFSWNAPDAAVTGYAIYWGTDSNGTSGTYQTGLTYAPGTITTDGTYYLRLQTKDESEQVSPWATLFTYKFDGSIPANVTYPVTETHGAVNNTCQDDTRRPAFSWNKPTDTGSGVAAYRVYFGKSLDEVVLPEATTIYGETFALNNDVAGGLYTLWLQAVDAAGNASSWQVAHVYCFASASGYVTPTSDLTLTTSLPADPNGQLVVELPADLHNDTLQVLIYPAAERIGVPAQFSVVGNQFEIEAISTETQQNVKQFDKEYTISYHYSDADILGMAESTLKVYYHNPVSGQWEALASSTVDMVNNIVSATIDHMSEFAIFGTVAVGDANITVVSGGAPNVVDSLVTFEAKTLTGSIQQSTASLAAPWVATDPSGSGNGWHVEMTATDFSNGSRSIAINNMQVKQQAGSITMIYGNALPATSQPTFAALDPVTPVKLLSAALDTGMGTYQFSPDFTLTIPAATFAGTYIAPVTLSIITAP